MALPRQNLVATTFSLGNTSLLIVQPGFNLAAGSTANSTPSLVHTAGTTLVVPPGKSFAISATISDPVVRQGSISARTAGEIYRGRPLTTSGAGGVAVGGWNSRYVLYLINATIILTTTYFMAAACL